MHLPVGAFRCRLAGTLGRLALRCHWVRLVIKARFPPPVSQISAARHSRCGLIYSRPRSRPPISPGFLCRCWYGAGDSLCERLHIWAGRHWCFCTFAQRRFALATPKGSCSWFASPLSATPRFRISIRMRDGAARLRWHARYFTSVLPPSAI